MDKNKFYRYNWAMIQAIKEEIHKVVIGHEELIDAMLVALLSGGHLYVEGVPGVAKTTAVKTLARVLGFDFKRIQFTPDLLPADITGSEILDLERHDFRIRKGPVFTHLLLADEINRAGPKVQAALLEAMAEKQVTLGEETFPLPDPFMVLATANPLEQEGTYELPEASLDRFMMKIRVGYNSHEEEEEIILRTARREPPSPRQILDSETFEELRRQVDAVHVDAPLRRYLLDIVFATREPDRYGLEDVGQWLEYGAGPRGSIDLYRASKGYAWLSGRDFVVPGDIARAAYGVLRHRLILSYRAHAEKIDADTIIHRILEVLEVP